MAEKRNKNVDIARTQSRTQLSTQKTQLYSAWNDKMFQLYSQNASIGDLGKAFGNVIKNNPELRNSVLKNLQTIPYLPEREDIESALTDPRNNEKLLRAIGGNLLDTCYPMYKLLRFYDSVLTYRWIVFPQNVNTKGMKTTRYAEEQRFVNQWIKKLNPPYQLRRIVQETLKSGKRAYYIRDIYSDNKKKDVYENDDGLLNSNRRVISVRLEDLPDDYVKIVGKSSQSYFTIAFDFTYFFSQSGVNIDNFPPFFRKTYEKISNFMYNDKGKIVIKDERSAKEFSGLRKFAVNNNNGLITYNYWVDIPSDECQVFSADESNPLQSPNFMGLFLMCADLQSYLLLQQQQLSIPLNSIIIGQIPFKKDKDDLALSPEQTMFYENMIGSLLPPGVSFVMSPSIDNKPIIFDEIPSANKIYTTALQGLIGTAGMSGVLSTTDKPNLSQNKTSQLIEKRFVDVFYEQFKDFINRRLEKMTNDSILRYDWEFDIYGDVFSDDKSQEHLLKAMGQGIKSVFPIWSSYYGKTLDDMVSLANQVEVSGIYDMLRPLVSSFQQSSNDIGRKDMNDSDVENDNTAKSKEAETNKGENRTYFNLYQELNRGLDEIDSKIEVIKEIIENQNEGGDEL